MRPFTKHQGVAAPLLQANIDTDAIIPSREMRRVSKRGLSIGLFANWRYADPEARTPAPDFVLNQPAYAAASILLCGANFGCGSSREHAVWALAEFGIRALVAPSFGAIFQKNCVANGLLPAVLPAAQVRAAAAWVRESPQTHRPTLDLATCTLAAANRPMRFRLRPADRTKLLQGLDPITHTLAQTAKIKAFEDAHLQAFPWARLD